VTLLRALPDVRSLRRFPLSRGMIQSDPFLPYGAHPEVVALHSRCVTYNDVGHVTRQGIGHGTLQVEPLQGCESDSGDA